MTNKMLPSVCAIVLLVALFVWVKKPHNETKSGTTDFSSWSRTAAGPAPASSASPERVPQNETQAQPSLPSRIKIDPATALKGRPGMLAVHEPSPAAQETFKNLPREAARQINSHRYQVLGAWAVPKEGYSASMGEVLQEQNNYSVVALDNSAGDSWKTLTVRPDARPVLISPDSGRLSVVTGTLVVKLKDLEKAGAIADSENLQVIGVDEQIHTVYYKAPVGYPLLSGLKRLQAHADVELAELELDQARKVGK
jgi:hypothetical protein